MSTEHQPEALIFANDRPSAIDDDLYQWAIDAEDLIRHQHTRIAELEAQLSATNPIQQGLDAQMWAPIDTAPKDGSWIQLWREPEKRIGDRAPLVFGRWHDEYESWVWPDQPHYDPFTERGIERANRDIEAGNAFRTDAFTHWHPLEKPALAAQAKQGCEE